MVVDFQVGWEEIWENKYELSLFFFFFLGYVFYIIYELYAVSSRGKPLQKEGNEGVSVVITSHNNAEFLRKNLPRYLMQEYPDYEVIVVDECSEDETQDVLAEMQQAYPQLRITRIFPDTKFRFTKKLAINIGILAARHDIVLFSEVNCRPVSSFWVRKMQACFDHQTAVVVGLANYNDKERDIVQNRYFRFARFLKMLLLIRSGQNILGDGCNLAYRKSYYITNRGFTLNSQSFLGYDNDMVTELSRFGKVRVAKDIETYVQVDKCDKKGQVDEIAYFFASRMRWSFFRRLRADADRILRLCFYGMAFFLLCRGVLPVYVLMLTLFAYLSDFIATCICARRLGQRKLLLFIFVVSLVGFAWRWYWNVRSFFNRNKWR